jgi:hypothetical protein
MNKIGSFMHDVRTFTHALTRFRVEAGGGKGIERVGPFSLECEDPDRRQGSRSRKAASR